MNYRTNPKNGDSLSILGLGCMRFPKDEKEQEKIFAYCLENGVNFYDTAYLYPGSEAALGRLLAKDKTRRERIFIGTKMPHYIINEYSDFDKYFNIQLKRLGTDYIDYYMIHMLSDTIIWDRLRETGAEDWIEGKKKAGRIKNIGFSYHGGQQEFKRLIDAYPWEFTMIQYNYLDEYNQAGRSGLEYAASKGLPVIAMEPLRGGRLVQGLPKEAVDLMNKAPVHWSPAEWGLRWVWNHPGVTVALSGVSSGKMAEENIRAAERSQASGLSKEELELIKEFKKIILAKATVPCTGCNYCMPCPMGVDIPTCLSCYNIKTLEGWVSAMRSYFMQVIMRNNPGSASLCSQCGVCEPKCPQKILIRRELSNTVKALEGTLFKLARILVKKVYKLKD